MTVDLGELTQPRPANLAALPEFGPGDTIRVMARVVEGERERLQPFEGVVIRVREGAAGSFTVRRIASGVGVERTFPWNSPRVEDYYSATSLPPQNIQNNPPTQRYKVHANVRVCPGTEVKYTANVWDASGRPTWGPSGWTVHPLRSFGGTIAGDKIQLRWQMGSVLGIESLNLLRAEAGRPLMAERVNDVPIPTLDQAGRQILTYSYDDDLAGVPSNWESVWYTLEAVGAGRSTRTLANTAVSLSDLRQLMGLKLEPSAGAGPVHVSLLARQDLEKKPEVRVFDVAGRAIQELELTGTGGILEATWDGRREDGAVVGSGVYFVVARLDSEVIVGRVTRLGN